MRVDEKSARYIEVLTLAKESEKEKIYSFTSEIMVSMNTLYQEQTRNNFAFIKLSVNEEPVSSY